MLISEDARLVALPIGGGELAVSRARPNEFTVDNWKRALRSETIVVPEMFSKADGQFDIADAVELPPGAPFYCTDGVCLARHPSGAIIAHVEDRKDTWKACGFADLIVVNDATGYDACHNPLVLVVTKRQLARKGSAAVFFDRQSATASTNRQLRGGQAVSALALRSANIHARRGGCCPSANLKSRPLLLSSAGSARPACLAP